MSGKFGLSAYLTEVFRNKLQLQKATETARSSCNRPRQDEDDDESRSTQPDKPLVKKVRLTVDEPMVPITRFRCFSPTLRQKSVSPSSLATIREEEPLETKERKFFKSKKASDVRKPYLWKSSMTRRPVVRMLKYDATPSTSSNLIQPKLTTFLEQQETNDKGLSSRCKKSPIKKNTAKWPRNLFGKSNYSNVNKRFAPLPSSQTKSKTIAESFRIEEKRQYEQLLHQCSLKQSQPSQSPSRSNDQTSSTSSGPSSPFTHDVRWLKSPSPQSLKSKPECENTSPVFKASSRVATRSKLLSNANETVNKKSAQSNKAHPNHHTSSRVQSPLSDITMEKRFSVTNHNECITSERLRKEEDSFDEFMKLFHRGRKKRTPVDVIDLCLTETDSLDSMRDSDSDGIEIVDEFPRGRNKNFLEELYRRNGMEMPVQGNRSGSSSRDYHITSDPSVNNVNKIDENSEPERMSPSQTLHKKVEVRLNRLDVVWASPDKCTSVNSQKEPSYALLTPEMQHQIDAVLVPFPNLEVLVHKFNIGITRRDIMTLKGMNWLNDEVINFYMNLIMDRSSNKGLPKVYVFSTFFYPKLYQSGHKSVSRWTKKVDIFTYDILLIPIHFHFHWCMAIVDFKKKCIRYYDSMLGDNDICLETLLEYLEAEHMDKKKRHYITKAWKLQSMKNIPQQMNGSDCGVFSCKFAEYMSRLAPLNFRQEDMPYFRRQMVYEIINGKLME